MTAAFRALRASIKSILQRPHDISWTVQGFGMLRTYLDGDKVWRLNVWDKSLTVPKVSTIHDHPWHFTSTIISGGVTNLRYVVPVDPIAGDEYEWMTIRCGIGGGPENSKIDRCVLRCEAPERYAAGSSYWQIASEIHETLPDNGAVTLNERSPLPDGEHARIFWRRGGAWVNAAPRAATTEEIERVIRGALKLWR
jgi:hypothetical protein